MASTGGTSRSVQASVIDHIDDTATTQHGKPTLRLSSVYDEAREKIDTTFENAKTAYTSKTNFELLRGYTVFQLCSVKLFVSSNKQVNTPGYVLDKSFSLMDLFCWFTHRTA